VVAAGPIRAFGTTMDAGLAPSPTIFGPSGGFAIPDGRVLPDGSINFGFNNYLDSRYKRADRGENYLFGIGILPYVELSGKVTNYPFGERVGTFGGVLSRDLSANLKVALPRLGAGWQPDIAAGYNDIGGGAVNFRRPPHRTARVRWRGTSRSTTSFT
jgi:hypothetical protein